MVRRRRHSGPEDERDKYQRINDARMEKGEPMLCVYGGILGYGKYDYRADGMVYLKRRKTPIGRYLCIERFGGGGEVALRAGRLDEAHEIEALRWRILTRVHEVLIPEMNRRRKEVRKFSRASFRGYHNGEVYLISPRGERGSYQSDVKHQRVDDSELPVLDQLGGAFTTEEADRMATRYLSMCERLEKGWQLAGLVTCLLIRALEQAMPERKPVRSRLYYDQGELVEVTVNGRRYTTWVGPGGMFRHESEYTRLWPSPSHKAIDLDLVKTSGKAARYGRQNS